MSHDSIEQYTASVGLGHRRDHGQFFTPFDVALFMCRWVMAHKPTDVYDPSFGLGAFFKAAQAVDSQMIFRASEIDPRILEFYSQANGSPKTLHVTREDYLSAWNQRHEAIVCNPPYMRFQLFTNRDAVFASFAKHLDCQLSGYTNIASAFLIKSLAELRPSGRLAYIMPLEFLNTGYGEVVKERLLNNGLLKALIRINPEKDVFPDATTSVGIVLVENDGVHSPVKFYTASSLSCLPSLLESTPTKELSGDKLKPKDKWLKHFDERHSDFQSCDLVTIDTYGTFNRGIATGANEFFAMSNSEAECRHLPRSVFLRCITKSAQVTKSVFTEDDLNALDSGGAPVLLLNLNGAVGGAARDYLKCGEEKGYNQRYLTRVRNPWYKLEKRTPAPLLFGVFSRERFKVIRNLSTAVNLTCYHGFYPNLFGQVIIDSLFLYFQSRAARRLLELNMRRYGDSLDKFEPNDLNRAFAPSVEWFAKLPPDAVSKALELCRNGNGLPGFMDDLFDELISEAEHSHGTLQLAHRGPAVVHA
ncbi:MAG: N-6 DNA methylase [Kiritimatiellaceae bacterium]|nr:N-6 DNA methylase [Kiritimatiellaceae bacterium]